VDLLSVSLGLDLPICQRPCQVQIQTLDFIWSGAGKSVRNPLVLTVLMFRRQRLSVMIRVSKPPLSHSSCGGRLTGIGLGFVPNSEWPLLCMIRWIDVYFVPSQETIVIRSALNERIIAKQRQLARRVDGKGVPDHSSIPLAVLESAFVFAGLRPPSHLSFPSSPDDIPTMKCSRNGCKQDYEPENNIEGSCVHHSGTPVGVLVLRIAARYLTRLNAGVPRGTQVLELLLRSE